MFKEEVIDKIIIFIGGCVVEEVIFNICILGVLNDIE